MALPKSTFVMGIVTLGLFGVAIYETAGKKGGAADRRHLDDDDYDDEDLEDNDLEVDDDDESLEEYRSFEAERERRRAEEAEQTERELAKKKAGLRALVGAEVAMPGPLFAGIALDDTSTSIAASERLAEFSRATSFSVDLGTGDKHDRFSISPDEYASYAERDELCGELNTLLGTTWGSAYLDDDGAALWTNKVTRVRARFKARTSCELVFERYDEPATWLGTSGTSTVPLSWLGKPKKVVEDAVGSAESGGVIEWTAHGVGAGREATSLTATIENGKVTRIAAQTFATRPTREALAEHLRRTLGTPKVDETSGDLRLAWPARRLTVLLAENGAVVVTIGAP
ncbi:MAG: hypothetical protein JNL83_15395 [Myxococcales bacterium]|nr:hypothetical protein [Myxococcales bacterium]